MLIVHVLVGSVIVSIDFVIHSAHSCYCHDLHIVTGHIVTCILLLLFMFFIFFFFVLSFDFILDLFIKQTGLILSLDAMSSMLFHNRLSIIFNLPVLLWYANIYLAGINITHFNITYFNPVFQHSSYSATINVVKSYQHACNLKRIAMELRLGMAENLLPIYYKN